MSQVTITAEGGKVFLRGPYHPDLPEKAHMLGGDYDGDGTWTFDGRDEARVRDLAVEIYGTDGSPVQQCTVRLDIDAHLSGGDPQTLWFAGREIVHRPRRDDRVRLGEGVIVVEGGFARSGGSVKNPRISCKAGTVVEIRDLPRPAVDAATADGVTIISEQAPAPKELRAERNKLLVRLDEIDALLTGASE